MSDPVQQLEVLRKATAVLTVGNVRLVKAAVKQATATAMYLAAKGADDEARKVASWRLDLQRAAGILLESLPKQTGGDAMKARSGDATEVPPTLAEQGIDKHDAATWQRLAEIPDEEYEAYKETAVDVTTAGALRVANKERQKDNTTAPVPDGVFDVLYADPPWRYENSGFAMSAEQQYPTMETKAICYYRDKDGREIHDAVADDAVLFLWVTNPLLRDGLAVMDAWGFDYKTNMVWIKKTHTAGFYVFGQHELLLIGTRGTGMLPKDKPKSIVQGDNSVHSRKPECLYSVIEAMYPGRKYLELFQRRARDGWTGVGNGI